MRIAVLLALIVGACATQEAPHTTMSTPVLFDFTNASVARGWRSVDDDVMGGVSSSRIEPGVDSGPRGARFVGTVSLENNGGFSQIRTAVPEGTYAGTTGLIMRVKGDGRSYQCDIRSSRLRLMAGGYQSVFKTKARWQLKMYCESVCKSLRAWLPLTLKASFIATSSPQTSWWAME